MDGADLYPGVPLKIGVILVSYGEPCNTGLLQKAMDMGNMRRDRTPITRCVNVRTARNQVVPLFIQDSVAEFLPKEIPLGNAVTFYAILMFITPDKVGLLVNEFSKGDTGK